MNPHDHNLFSHKNPEHEFSTSEQEQETGQRRSAPAPQRNTVAYGLVLALVFLLPFFFVPFPGFPVGFTKAIFFGIVGVLAGAFVFFDARQEEASVPVVYPLVLLGLLAAFIVSTLFSLSPWVSILGGDLAADTLVTIAAVVLVSLALPRIIQTKKRAFFVLVTLFASGALLFVFQLVRFLFGPSVLSFNIFGAIESTTAGSWHELGFFAGLFVIMATLLTQFMSLSREMKYAVWSIGVLAALLVVAVSFGLVFLVLSVAHLLITIYAFTQARDERSVFSQYAVPLILTIIFAACFFLTGALNTQMEERFGSVYTQVRPDLSSTLDVAQDAWSSPQALLVGTGPHTFSYLWQDHRPESEIQGPFWNTPFEEGTSQLLTIVITTGLLGLIAVASVVGYVVWRVVTFVKNPPENPLMRVLLAVTLGGTTYLMAVLTVTVVSPFLFVLAFFFLAFATSIEVQGARLRMFGGAETRSIMPILARSAGVLSIIVLVPFLSLTVARVLYASGSLALTAQDEDGITVEEVQTAEERIELALRFEKNDNYGQLLVDFKLARLRELLARLEQEEITQEQFVEEFNVLRNDLTSAVSESLDIDPRDHVNWISYGNVYEAFGALGVEGANQEAQRAYTRAREENPTSPEVPLIQARFAALQENVDQAESFVQEALNMKTNYVDAHLYLASLVLQEEGTTEAIEILDTAVATVPSNALLRYEKGLLHYEAGEYDVARDAFSAALQLEPTSQNAQYQLALSMYNGTGSNNDALVLMQQLQEANPDNTLLPEVIENMEAGNAPLAGVEGAQQTETTTEESAAVEDTEELGGESEVQEEPDTNVDTDPTPEAELSEDALEGSESDL